MFKEGESFVITRNEVLETNQMIEESNLDVRTITMGINLMDCADADIMKKYIKKLPLVQKIW